MPDSRYRITERIAAGGMAEVFRGVAESLQGFRKNVAIKRILPALTRNERFVTMFLDEAHLSLHLQHANIVQMFDIGHADDTYFIVMEYVDGVDLKAILDWRRRIGRRLTVGQTIYIIMEVCKGLAYAHDLTHPETGKPLGIVHRDVSPANVLFSRNGEVKLADFGLAKATSQIESTDPGVVKGKMSYLSPEAARGENVDRRADIFAVGILLYEMLTGKRLFYGDSDYQTVELVRNAKIPSIATQNPEVEGEFEEICRKALTKRVEDRFQTATDLQDALAHYLFSRGLKMIQRDIAELVRSCLEDQAAQSSGGSLKKTSVIDTIFHKEMDAFTSVEFEGEDTPMVHAQTTSSEFIDPRNWSTETDLSSHRSGRRDTVGTFLATGPATASRDTINEMPARNTAGMPVTLDPTRPPPSSVPMSLQPSSINLPNYSPSNAPINPAANPESPLPFAMRKGLLFSVMAIAVVVGATLAWLLVNSR
jgi:serine/threonine-protein kinase